MFHGSLNTNISRLQFSAKELMVTACISFTGKYVPDTVNAVIHIEVDPEHNRAQFMEGNAVMQYNHNLTHGSSFCKDHEIVINSDADMNDFSKPLKLTMKCHLVEEKCHKRGGKEEKFNKFCPVVDPTSPFKTTVLLPYVTGCSDDDLCRTDIKTEMEVMELE
ncbi:hypothetical protein J437_LFUL008963 [Ladona fulva]|uniref:Integrin alpha first immunoglubulin-like domain-containing protein n=1 Tax=Ladona fulva TaxID=123851 RepID=A0A8K0KE30_LADFU|nr:hypothetical protein J437_LFUL008963 [Ladona fulva]